MIVRPNRSRNSVAIFPSGSPSCLFSTTASVTAAGPSWALAAPMASEVWSGWRPCTRRPQSAHWLMAMSNAQHDRPDVGQILLILRRVPRRSQSATTIRTPRRQRRRVALINVWRDGSMRLPTIRVARLPSRPPWSTTRRAARELRRLPVQRPPRILQFVFESVDLLPQALTVLTMAVALAFQLASQPLVFVFLAFEFRDQVLAPGRAPARLHAPVMPRADQKYKRKLWRSCNSGGDSRRTTSNQ